LLQLALVLGDDDKIIAIKDATTREELLDIFWSV
jgi:hypothetical protein